jgi:hypothetical protein
MSPDTDYASYLLRFRKMRIDWQTTWLASVQSTSSGEQRSFPGVEALAAFLIAEYGGNPSEPGQPGAEEPEAPDLTTPALPAGWQHK